MSFDPPVIINVRDRLAPLRELVAWLERAGHERIVLLDNASTYEPLLDFYRDTPHTVLRLGENLGARAVWHAGLAPADEPFVYTDPDIVPIEDCPLNAVARLRYLMDAHDAPKVALGLYLDDVPESCPHLEWERSLVAAHRQIAPGVFTSLVDTTFALHRPGQPFIYGALRLGYPYQARHLSPSWYGGEPTDEDRYYLQHARKDPCHGSSWAATA